MMPTLWLPQGQTVEQEQRRRDGQRESRRPARGLHHDQDQRDAENIVQRRRIIDVIHPHCGCIRG